MFRDEYAISAPLPIITLAQENLIPHYSRARRAQIIWRELYPGESIGAIP